MASGPHAEVAHGLFAQQPSHKRSRSNDEGGESTGATAAPRATKSFCLSASIKFVRKPSTGLTEKDARPKFMKVAQRAIDLLMY